MAEWLENLPDDLKENPALKDTPDVETLARRFVDTKSAVGQGIRIPSENASDDDWKEFNDKLRTRVPDLVNLKDKDGLFDKLGRPKSPDEYDLGETPVKLDPEFEKSVKGKAHELGLTNEQLQGLMSENLKAVQQAQSQAQESMEKAESDLKEAWGEAYQTKRSDALLAAEKYGLTPEGLPAGVMQALADVGSTLRESGAPAGQGAGAGALTPSEAQARIDEIRSNKGHAYHNRHDPNHGKAVEEFYRLHKYLHPNVA